MYAEDAHASATFLALLFFLWGAVSLLSLPAKPFGFWNSLQAVVGGLSFGYFVSTRRRPSTRTSVVFAAVVVAYSLALLPWTMVMWCRLGRPWEAFTVSQVGMLSMASVVPRFFWLGVGLTGLFAAESGFAYVYARHVGMEALVPSTEPYFSLLFAILGLGLLAIRHQRRQLARRHITAQAEADALRRVGPLFVRFRDELDLELARLSSELHRIPAEAAISALLPRMDRAVDRLAALSGTLDSLVDAAPTAQPTSGEARPSAQGSMRLVASEAERRVLARDAHTGATIFTGMLLLISVIVLFARDVLTSRAVYIGVIAETVLCLMLFFYLLRMRRAPSERRAFWVTLVMFAVTLPLTSYNQLHLLTQHRPFAPFMMLKFLMVMMALLAGSRFVVALLLVLVMTADALGIYFYLDLGAHKDVIPLFEPWTTLIFTLISVASLVMRERRRVASIRVLRAESEASMLHRRATMILALRDQLNSPLQTLMLGAATLELDPHWSSSDVLAQVRATLARLTALSTQLAGLEDLIPAASQRDSFDGGRELAPLAHSA